MPKVFCFPEYQHYPGPRQATPHETELEACLVQAEGSPLELRPGYERNQDD